MTIAPERIETRLDAAIDAATERLLELQHPEGYWVGELESNVTMTAQHLFWHHVLGLRTPELDRRISNELLARQRDDGTWSIWFEGPPDLDTTVEAYAALKLAGVDPGAKAQDFIRSEGGIPKTRIFTKCFLALLGQWPWQRVTPIPVELVLFPPSAPFSIYNFSCWARGTFVPLAACRALRPVRPAAIDLREIGARPGESKSPAPPSSLRRAALREAERWVRAHQEADGSWGGIQPPWVWSIVMLAALGHGFEDETLRRAVEGWEGFMVEEGDRLRPEACQSPVWDTGLAVLALRDSGLGPEHPGLVRAAEWLLQRGGDRPGRLGRAPPRPRARRLGLRVRERPLPGRGRCGRRRARPAALPPRPRRRRSRARLDRGDAVQERGLGCLRRRQRGLLALQAPVLRLRQGHRRAERRRHRARARGARPGGRLRRRGAPRARLGCWPSRRPTARGSGAGA